MTFSAGRVVPVDRQRLDQMRVLRRSPRLDQVAATAAFLASDRAAAITATFVNLTSGFFPS